MAHPPLLEFDRPKLERLKKAQEEAIASGQVVYVFEGHRLLVRYAKYVIEYLEDRLK